MTRLEVSAHLVDARGFACPRPIIDLARALRLNAVVELWADDPAAFADLEAFVQTTGHWLQVVRQSAGGLQAVVRRGG